MGVSNPTSLPVSSPASNPVAVREVNPLTILGPSNVPFWINGDNRVMGAAPDIETLTNIADPTNANPTQGTAGLRPHLLELNGKNVADFVSGTNQRLDVASTPVDLIIGGVTPAASLFFSTAIPSVDGTQRCIIEVANTVAGNSSGLTVQATTSGFRIRVHAGAAPTLHDIAHTHDTDMHAYELRYDGVDMALYQDGVLLPSGSAAKTGTLSNDCDQVTLAALANQTNALGNRLREAVLGVGGFSSAQSAAMASYLMENAGI